jgi:cell division protein FtsZ
MISFIEEKGSLTLDENYTSGARIKVVGVGGGGGNAINRMISAGLKGVEFIAANTDLQVLKQNEAPIKIQLGSKATKGLGTGYDPDLGMRAALEDVDRIMDILDGADMVFVTAGMGGGTGTGGAPVFCQLANSLGALTVAVVTTPFKFEGKKRMKVANDGIRNLKESVDTVITIPNEKLLSITEENTPMVEAFRIADEVLLHAVRGIADLITTPGFINLDFADVRRVMEGRGMALMGTGIGTGENRAIEAVQQAISNPLLEETSIRGAKGILVNITMGEDISMREVGEAMELVENQADAECDIIFGQVFDKNMKGKMKVTVIATGFSPKANYNDERVTWVDFKDPDAERRKQVVNAEIRSFGTYYNDSVNEDELDVPTFIRKQAD